MMRGDFSFVVKDLERTFRLYGFSADLPPITVPNSGYPFVELRDSTSASRTITATATASTRHLRALSLRGCRGTATARFQNNRWKITPAV